MSSPRILPAPLGPLRLPPGLPSLAPDLKTDAAIAAAMAAAGAAPPRLSVVTPSYNQGEFLETTIRSVLQQNYPNLEYFVIDGGSKDRSAEVIRHYAAQLDGWVSEPDQGQYDAIFKGLRRATGEWFIWINSDDVLAPGALWQVAAASRDADVVAGATHDFEEDRMRKRIYNHHLSARTLILEPLNSQIKFHQPSIWLRREGMASLSLDQSLHYRFDYDLFIRYLHRYPRVRQTPATLAYFRQHNTSKTQSLGPRFRTEHVQILERMLAEPEFASIAGELDLGLRSIRWLLKVDELMAARERLRFERLRELIAGVRADPEARCSRISRRSGRRILMHGGNRR